MCDDTGVDGRSVGNRTIRRQSVADNSILEPAVTLLTDQRTSGVAVARAHSSLNCSGAYHVRFDALLIAPVQITTFLPVYHRYRDLLQDAS